MSEKITIEQLNAVSPEKFVAVLGGVFEHSPWVAELAAGHRPFRDLAHLSAAMADIVRAAPQTRRLQLIREHPELAGKAAVRGELTAESTREQQGAGLDQCSPEEFERLQDMNRRYGEKFGFPFVLAVRGYDRAGILAQFSRRLENERTQEMDECIEQIIRIGGYRLADLIG